MDIVSHGLWGAIAFGRKSRLSFWLAFVIGLAPDLLSFGILWTAAMVGLEDKPNFSHGTPPESSIPQYVHHLYNVTHSFIVFLIVFLLIWFLLKRPV
jgi:Na+/phosphate symporter